MKIIMSHWSRPRELGLSNRWLNPRAFALSWLLSVESAARSYSRPHLYADAAGAKLLVDDLGLEFSSVSDLNGLEGANPSAFALARASAVLSQNDPFLHIDPDCYLFESFPNELFSSGAVFEREVMIDNSNGSLHPQGSICHRPEFFSEGMPDWWASEGKSKFLIYRCGLMGGSNLGYFRTVAANAFEKRNDPRGAAGSYTLFEYGSAALAAKMGLRPRFAVTRYDTLMASFAHVGPEKVQSADYYGRLLHRLMRTFPEKTKALLERIGEAEPKTPRVSVVILPNGQKTIYDRVLRALVPRKIQPDELIVVSDGLPAKELSLIGNLEGVKVIPFAGGTEAEVMRKGFSRATGDIVIFIDGKVKAPKLYVEKTIAASFEHPETILCATNEEKSVREIRETEQSYDGFVAFPRGAFERYGMGAANLRQALAFARADGKAPKTMMNLVVSEEPKAEVPSKS